MVAVVTDLPTACCDRVRMAEVFQNLIANALKFTNGRPPVIRIGGEDRPDTHLLWVSDNGPGVPEAHRERVFKIFQRLHTREEYPGTGVGLALCKKIVEDHGGRIWAEPGPGKGSRLCFTLPKPSPEDEKDAGGGPEAGTAG